MAPTTAATGRSPRGPIRKCANPADSGSLYLGQAYLGTTSLRSPVAASLAETAGELLLLLVALMPTGLSILRGIETLLRHRFAVTPLERGILGFYATGTLLFLLASIPVPIYGRDLLAIVLFIGTAHYIFRLIRHHASGFRTALTSIRAPPMIIVAAGFVGLLIFELAPVWSHPFPNAWDGSVTALWTNLILRQHTIPSSLEPFGSAPVIYPLGTSIWMTVPALMFGWSAAQSPVLLPPLFLGLTVPAAYAWGTRWSRDSQSTRTTVGLVFAAFVGLVSGFPLLLTGGGYDFALAFPLLMVTVGILPEWARGSGPGWPTLAGLGLVCGAMAVLSLAAGEVAIVLALAFAIALRRGSLRELLVRVAQVALLIPFELAFTLRSVIEWSTNQRTGYVPIGYYGAFDSRLVSGEMNPFVPWKEKLSPFPWVALEIQILLAGGLILLAIILLWPNTNKRMGAGHSLSVNLLIGTVASLLVTAFLLLTAQTESPWESLGRVTNLSQVSEVLFLFFDGIALLPLAVVASELFGRETVPDSTETMVESGTLLPHRRARRGSRRILGARGAALATVLIVSLTVGAASTIAEGQGYIQSNVGKTSNVTPGDVEALEWAGSHLPSCSVVFVAPGSAAQFLPEYATVRVAFLMNPVPTNSSYLIAIANLTGGTYGLGVREALVALAVTVIFVTGQTSVSYPPISPVPLETSGDFSILFESGDAFVFSFLPGVALTGCTP